MVRVETIKCRTENVDKTKDQFFEKINKVNKPFVAAVQQIFEKRGKIKGKVQMDLNFFMIYYVFPSILMTQSDDAKLMADTLCETWSNSFKGAKIGYTDYDTLYESFKEKIFGIF